MGTQWVSVVTVKTTTGPVTSERPKLRGTTEAFASRLFGKYVTKANALEALVIAAFVRGLSVRDVQATLAEALGDQAAISKSTVSKVCKAVCAEYQAWARRPLADVTLFGGDRRDDHLVHFFVAVPGPANVTT